MTRYASLSDCLWDAFANTEYCNPQEPQYLWAIREGLQRVDPMCVDWHEVKANKDHTCVRGCTIKRNDFYFQLQSGAGWGSEPKVCAACLAMILFFKQVEDLPPSTKTHWDMVEQRAVHLKSEDVSPV